MSAPDLAAMAAQALSAAASGAANTAASELVRGRLGRSSRGRAALDGLADAPSDPEAIGAAQAAVAEEIDGDAEFAERLTVLLHSSSQQHTGSVVMTGSKVSRSQIALGPITVNNTRAGKLSLVAALVLAVALVALAAYGGTRLMDGGAASPPRDASPDRDPARAEGRTTALPPTTGTVRQILPDRGGMNVEEYPWAGKPEVRTSAAGLSLCREAPVCRKEARAVGAVVFGRGENEGENRAEFVVLAFADAPAARRAYADVVDDIERADPQNIKVALERRGEESQGIDQDGTDTRGGALPTHVNRSLIFRQGGFIGVAHQMDDPTGRRGTRVLDLSAVLADRVAKADAGKVP